MLVQDVGGQTRLYSAKQNITELLQKIPLSFGLTIFAGEAQRVLPFTSDRDLYLSVLRSVDDKNLRKQGSDLSAAL